jgi:DNA replication protein DnaC
VSAGTPRHLRVASRGDGSPASCPLGACDGSGWILGPEDVARPCDCRESRMARRRARGIASAIPARFRDISFSRGDVQDLAARHPEVVAHVRAFTEEIGERVAAGAGLWLMGDVGTGKTALAMLASKHALEAGHSVAIYSAPKLLAHIRATYGADSGGLEYVQLFEKLTSVDLLHVDDLGAEKRTDWVLEQLYSVVNERYEAERSMVLTTNLAPEALEEQIGARTVSRLVEICGDPLPLFGDDQRYAVG